jgi:serine-type D-Ala-D-Ala carboxypeptidase/endopeptidase (penicillin-binding protein 4)
VLKKKILFSFILSFSSFFSLNAKQISYDSSIVITRLQDNKILYEKNPSSLLTPASIAKLFSSAALLHNLGANFKMNTKFYYTGEIKNQTISKDLIVVGDGDPFLVSQDLWTIANELRLRGIRKIKGHLIIDSSLFLPQQVRKTFAKPKSHHAYDAIGSSFAVNFNSHEIKVYPNKNTKKTTIQLSPYSYPSVKLNNKSIFSEHSEYLTAHTIAKKPRTEIITIKGKAKNKTNLSSLYVASKFPLNTASMILRSFLENQGITINKSTVFNKGPQNKTFLFQHTSRSLEELIKIANLYSNNLMMDMLTCRMGSFFNSTPQKACETGLNLIKKFSSTIDKQIFLYEPSGLSNKNKLSSQAVVALLAYMHKRFAFSSDFISCLAKAGSTGTLLERFKNSLLKGVLRAKTGTLTEPLSVSSLAGYLYHPKHKLLAFSFIQNGKQKKKQPSILTLRSTQEKQLHSIYKNL